MIASLLLSTLLASDPVAPVLDIARADTPPRIDGVIDSEWEAAARLDTVLTQYGPVRGQPQCAPTSILFMYDDRSLYVAFDMHHPEPGAMNDALCPRDEYMPGEWIALLLDTWADGRQAYSFEINLANSQMDSRITPEGMWDYSWDAVWTSATLRTATGWAAEVEIPMTCLRFPDAPEQGWTFNIQRVISRGRENGWLVLARDQNQADLDNFARLDGLEGLHSSVGVELRPYISGIGTRDPGPEEWDTDLNAGADLKIGLSSSLVADLTAYPDFGQVEADEEMMNLSHFELFLDERRPFFLEAADVFDMPFNLFYSRRVGAATPGGAQIPITGGAKISGTLTRDLQFGFFDAVTDEVEDDLGFEVPLTNYGVLRMRQGFDSWSYLGISATSVDCDGASARAAALDGRMMLTDQSVLGLAAARTWNDPGTEGNAASCSFNASGEEARAYFESLWIEEGFDANAAGFTTLTGIWSNFATGTLQYEPGWIFGTSSVSMNAGTTTLNSTGDFIGRFAEFSGNLNFAGGGHVGGRVQYDGASFDPWEGPEGASYGDGFEGGIWFGSNWYSPLMGWAEYNGGRYDQDGTYAALDAGARYSPSSSLVFSVEADNYRTFGTRVWNGETQDWDTRRTDWRSLVGRMGLMFGPDADITLFSQYSRFSSVMGMTGEQAGEQAMLSALLGWRYMPGSMIYLLGEVHADRGDGAWSEPYPGVFLKMTWFRAF
jgi:hypothetical protein